MVDALNRKVDGLTAAPITADGQGYGLGKKSNVIYLN